jgi:hypothetical protein
MELDTVDRIRQAFYRLVGTEEDDDLLTARDEAENEVAYIFITRGCRDAQRYMLDNRYEGWHKRSAALSWSGTDAADGGRYSALPTDFLKAAGDDRESCLVQVNGNRWGREIQASESASKGDLYYFRGDELWLARTAVPRSPLYLEYYYTHPEWSDSLGDGNIDFPIDARSLIVAKAANVAKDDNWLLGSDELENKIYRALIAAEKEARSVARRSSKPRTFRKPYRAGNRW